MRYERTKMEYFTAKGKSLRECEELIGEKICNLLQGAEELIDISYQECCKVFGNYEIIVAVMYIPRLEKEMPWFTELGDDFSNSLTQAIQYDIFSFLGINVASFCIDNNIRVLAFSNSFMQGGTEFGFILGKSSDNMYIYHCTKDYDRIVDGKALIDILQHRFVSK